MNASVPSFLAGLITMCFAAIGLCFARFWNLNRDPLLVAFAIAFWLLAVSQALVGLSVVPREEQSWVYLLRVVAFVVIAIAIVRKNISETNYRRPAISTKAVGEHTAASEQPGEPPG